MGEDRKSREIKKREGLDQKKSQSMLFRGATPGSGGNYTKTL
jgi:hypothetical protein